MNKKQLLARCAELGIDTEALTTNAKLKEAIAAKEAELDSQEVVKEEASEEKAPGIYKDDLGRKWRFKDKAPKRLNVAGGNMSQEEILESEEVISELVYGNSTLLIQIH